MEKSGNNFHCVKCRLAYMNFDEMYEHIKKVHVGDLLTGLSRLDTANIPGPSAELDIVQPKEAEIKGEGAIVEDVDETEKSPQTLEKEKLEKLIEQRKNHAEILRKHFYGDKSRKDITEERKSEGKSCLEQLLLDKGKSKLAMDTSDEENAKKTVPVDPDGQKTFADLLGKPSAISEEEEDQSPKTEFKTSDTHDSESVDEEKLVILQISQMQNLLTNDLLRIYEIEADEMAARPKTPKAVTSESQIEFPEEELKLIHEDLKITSKTEGEGSAEIPQVRVREGGAEKEASEENMEVDQGFSIHVSGIHPKYKKRILNEIDSFKIRRQKIVTLSSGQASKTFGLGPSTSQPAEKSIYIPKIKKEVEYDSDDECYYYVENEKTEISPEQEKKDEEARAILDDKFGDVRTIRVDPYFEYLWRQSLEMKDSSWDISKMTDAAKSHAWSNPRLD